MTNVILIRTTRIYTLVLTTDTYHEELDILLPSDLRQPSHVSIYRYVMFLDTCIHTIQVGYKVCRLLFLVSQRTRIDHDVFIS